MMEFTGLEYILIDIANQYGMDKEIWDKRLDWAKDLVNQSNVEISNVLKEADEPVLMRKALRAYDDAKANEPTGFIMGLDATASGLICRPFIQ